MIEPTAQARRAACILAATLAFLHVAPGCGKKQTDPNEQEQYHLPSTGSHTNTDRSKPASPGVEVDEEGCYGVKAPATGTLEHAISELYAAASSEKDDEESFQRFYSQFDAIKEEAWVRKQYWPRARKHVSKYLEPGDGVAFQLCRRKQLKPDEVKVFVRSNDSQKSDPPITLKQDGDTWKVIAFTY